MSCRVPVAITLLALVSLTPPAQAQVNYTGSYSQNFDTLANTGSSSALPAGWAFTETGPNANTTYTAMNGGSNAGDTYSFGATSSTERAFGTIQVGTILIP